MDIKMLSLHSQQVSRGDVQTKSQKMQSQQIKVQEQDEYIHEEVIQAKPNAVIYSDSHEIIPAENESDSESVSFNPYTFDADVNETEHEEESENMTVRANDSQKSAQTAETPQNVTASSESESDNEAELEKLELERARIRNKLNSEQDDSIKESLRIELRSIESQINQLKAELNS